MKGRLGTEGHGEEDRGGPRMWARTRLFVASLLLESPPTRPPLSGELWTLGRWKLRVTREEIFKYSDGLLNCIYKRGLG